MPDLRAFNGIRYSDTKGLKDLVCPPYDVISPEEQVRLYERHPHNAVRVELPFSEAPDEAETLRYRRAAHHFQAWLAEGILVRQTPESLFVYRQDFHSGGAGRKRVTGVIGALGLEPFGAGILPHERTMPGPVEDRLALLRACPVNISPIYGIYGGRGSLVPYFESLSSRPPRARFVDDHSTLHRLWSIEAAGEIDMLREAVRSGPLVIADGHHRYETALAYHQEQGSRRGHHDAVMCLCVDSDVEDIEVLPYNRAFSTTVAPQEVEHRLVRDFPGKAMPSGEGARALEQSTADHALLFVLPHADVLAEVSSREVSAHVGYGRAPAWRALDVVALHEVVVHKVLPEGIDRLLFSSDADFVVSLVRNGGRTAGVVLKPLRPSDVIAVAMSGERMPQKASYFWPKAVTGLVFRSLL